MATKSDKQKQFFSMVSEVQSGKKKPHEVPVEVRKLASKITQKDALEFVTNKVEHRTKKAVLNMLKELREPSYINEDDSNSNAIAKTFNVKDNYEQYVKKHLGQPISQKELEAVDNFQEAKPTKIERTQIRYEKTDEFSNGLTVVIKKMKDNNQFSYNAFSKHTKPETEPEQSETTPSDDTSSDSQSSGPGAPAPSEPPTVTPPTNDNKDDIIISKSILFSDDIKGGAILSDFLKKLDI